MVSLARLAAITAGAFPERDEIGLCDRTVRPLRPNRCATSSPEAIQRFTVLVETPTFRAISPMVKKSGLSLACFPVDECLQYAARVSVAHIYICATRSQ